MVDTTTEIYLNVQFRCNLKGISVFCVFLIYFFTISNHFVVEMFAKCPILFINIRKPVYWFTYE